jgi:hypothetical protein
MTMSKDIEYHYVVSYREGYGWTIAADTESALFTDGTFYDWADRSWVVGYDSDEEQSTLEAVDLGHYLQLTSALRKLSEGE